MITRNLYNKRRPAWFLNNLQDEKGSLRARGWAGGFVGSYSSPHAAGLCKHTRGRQNPWICKLDLAALFISEYPMNLRAYVFPASLTTVSMEPRRPRLEREQGERRFRAYVDTFYERTEMLRSYVCAEAWTHGRYSHRSSDVHEWQTRDATWYEIFRASRSSFCTIMTDSIFFPLITNKNRTVQCYRLNFRINFRIVRDARLSRCK